jgi:hypothetical protein
LRGGDYSFGLAATFLLLAVAALVLRLVWSQAGFDTSLGPQGIRVICLRSDGIPETGTIDEVFGFHAKAAGIKSRVIGVAVET